MIQYTKEVIINLPLDKVLKLFDDPENLKKWQPGLQSFEHISGVQGEVGAKSRLIFKNGNKTFEMIETITKKDLPNEFSGIYEASGVVNVVKNFFTKIDENTTKYSMFCEFKFTNIMMNIIGFIFPGMFKSTSSDLLQNFKKFAESTN